MGAKVSNRHFAAKQKRYRPGEYSEENQDPAEEFQNSCQAEQGIQRDPVPSQQAEKFLCAVGGKKEAGDHAQYGKNYSLYPGEIHKSPQRGMTIYD